MELTILLLAIAAAGISMMYQYLILPGQLFSFMQRLLIWLQKKRGALPVFLYKRLGGCEVCNTQMFADLIYIMAIILIGNVAWWAILIGYVLFGGLVFYLYQLAVKINAKQPEFPIKKQSIEL